MTTTRQRYAAWLIPATMLLSNVAHALDVSTLSNVLSIFKPNPNATADSRSNANYLGASLGSAGADQFCEGLNNCDSNSNAWKAYAGVPIQNGLILDAAYVNFGEHQGKNNQGISTKAKRSGWSAAGVLTLPMSDDLHAYGKGGVIWWKSNESYPNNSTQADGRSTFYGVGADYKLGENLGLRAEWERYSKIGSEQLNSRQIDLLSMGVSMSSL